MKHLRLAIAVLALSSTSVAMAASETPRETLIPNVLPGISYIRLFGSSYEAPTTFRVTTIGAVTGREYKVHDYVVQPGLVEQISPVHLTNPNDPPLVVDTTFLVKVKGMRKGLVDIAGLYQHVRFNTQTRILENMSECSFSQRANDLGFYRGYYVDQGRFLPNLHTSSLVGYDSYISITNQDAVARTFQMAAWDSSTGVPGTRRLDGYLLAEEITIPARSTRKVPWKSLETKHGWQPGPAQMHVNLRVGHVFREGEPAYHGTAIVTHTVQDTASHVETNLAQYCPVEGVSITPNPITPANLPSTRVSNANCSKNSEISYTPCNSFIDHPGDSTTTAGLDGDFTPSGGVGSGAHANGQIYPAGGIDRYKVRLEKGGAYVVYATPSGFSTMTQNRADEVFDAPLGKVTIRLLDAGGQPVPLQLWEQNRDGRTVLTPTITSDYYLEVSAADGESTGGYQVVANSIYKTDLCSPANPEDRFVTEHQCNPTRGDFPANPSTPGLLAINALRTSSALTPASDVDWFQLYVIAGTTYIINVDRVGTGEGTSLNYGLSNRRVSVISPSGTILATDTGAYQVPRLNPVCPVPLPNAPKFDANGLPIELCQEPPLPEGDPATITYVATDTGTVYVEVKSSDGISFGGYSVFVTR